MRFYKTLVCLTLLITTSTAVNAGMVADSHNDKNAIGRARANVVHNQTKSTLPTQPKQNPLPNIESADIADINESIEPATEIIPEPIPEPDLSTEIATASEYIAQLQDAIQQIDSEIARCKSAKRNWTIGTVAGSAGVVGTATGAIIQSVQINKAKKNGATEESDTDSDDKESK